LQNEDKFPLIFYKNSNKIDNISHATGVVYYYYCEGNDKGCYPKYKVDFVAKTYKFILSRCKRIDSNHRCIKWVK
jgi:hypothetical protein